MSTDPKGDQLAAAARDAAALQADFYDFIKASGRVRQTLASPAETPPAIQALIGQFNERNQVGMLACAHLHASPAQPVFWLAYAPDRVSCLRCLPRLMDELAPNLEDLCDLCGQPDDDLTGIWGTLDRVTIRGFLCERCHPTGL